jgi:hypothetical protein
LEILGKLLLRWKTSQMKKLHVYVKYGHDIYGEYVETLYFKSLVTETESLVYIGEIDSSKVNINEDTKAYI